jgi:DNA-binding MarR family transcriptional regulator
VDIDSIQTYRRLLRKFRSALPLHLDNYCSDLGLTYGQGDVLLEIEENGPTNLTGLSGKLGLDKSTLSRTVDGLVELGYVDRTCDPSDRRCNILTLTASGETACAEINAAGNECADDVLSRIPESQRAAALEGFRLMTGALRSHAANEHRRGFKDEGD